MSTAQMLSYAQTKYRMRGSLKVKGDKHAHHKMPRNHHALSHPVCRRGITCFRMRLAFSTGLA